MMTIIGFSLSFDNTIDIAHLVVSLVTGLGTIVGLLIGLHNFRNNIKYTEKLRRQDFERKKLEKLADEYKEFIYNMSMFYKKSCLLKEKQIIKEINDSDIAKDFELLELRINYEDFGAKVQSSLNTLHVLLNKQEEEFRLFRNSVNKTVDSVHEIMKSTNPYFNDINVDNKLDAHNSYESSKNRYRIAFIELKESFELVHKELNN